MLARFIGCCTALLTAGCRLLTTTGLLVFTGLRVLGEEVLLLFLAPREFLDNDTLPELFPSKDLVIFVFDL